jgi:hypothetical protein
VRSLEVFVAIEGGLIAAECGDEITDEVFAVMRGGEERGRVFTVALGVVRGAEAGSSEVVLRGGLSGAASVEGVGGVTGTRGSAGTTTWGDKLATDEDEAAGTMTKGSGIGGVLADEIPNDSSAATRACSEPDKRKAEGKRAVMGSG